MDCYRLGTIDRKIMCLLSSLRLPEAFSTDYQYHKKIQLSYYKIRLISRILDTIDYMNFALDYKKNKEKKKIP